MCVHSLLQASALLLFNEVDELSYQEVQERLNLPEEDVSRLLHSLSCAKYKILTKDPATRTISKLDKFAFNNKFTDRMKRIKVSSGARMEWNLATWCWWFHRSHGPGIGCRMCRVVALNVDCRCLCMRICLLKAPFVAFLSVTP